MNEFTKEELQHISQTEAATKVVAKVVLRNGQTLHTLNAKVDTIGINVVRQVKQGLENQTRITKTQNETKELISTHQSSYNTSKAIQNGLNNMLSTETATKEKISHVSELLELINKNIDNVEDELIDKMDDRHGQKIQDLESIKEQTIQLTKHLDKLDYTKRLQELNDILAIVVENMDIHNESSNNLYQTLAVKIDIFELAMKNARMSLNEYSKNLKNLEERVLEILSHLDQLEHQLYSHQTTTSEADILLMFENYKAENNEETINASTNVEDVDESKDMDESDSEINDSDNQEDETPDDEAEIIELECYEDSEPVITRKEKKKKGFFSFLKGDS